MIIGVRMVGPPARNVNPATPDGGRPHPRGTSVRLRCSAVDRADPVSSERRTRLRIHSDLDRVRGHGVLECDDGPEVRGLQDRPNSVLNWVDANYDPYPRWRISEYLLGSRRMWQ